MYVELFLADNAVMDFLILRLAAALCGRKARMGRLALFALGGALYALGAALYAPLSTAAAKLTAGGLLSLALPAGSVRGRLRNAAAVLVSAFAAGGLTAALALLQGGGMAHGAVLAGVSLRCMLYAAACVSVLPRLLRGFERLRLTRQGALRLTVCAGGVRLELPALVDSGNLLCEPLTGKPLIVAYAPVLLPLAAVRIPVRTAGGGGMLRLLSAELLLDGKPTNALLALCESPLYQTCALVPPAALPLEEDPLCSTASASLHCISSIVAAAVCSLAAHCTTSTAAKPSRRP